MRRTESNLADALGPLIVPKRPDAQTPKRPDAPTPNRPAASTPKRSELPLQGTAMSKHPDFDKKTLYLRASTLANAVAEFRATHGRKKTESEVVQFALEEYLRGDR